MKITLQITDESYEVYEAHSLHLQQVNGKAQAIPEDLMAKHLERFCHVSPADRIVVVDSKNRQRLEEILQGGSLKDAADLVKRIELLASLEIGEVKVDFSPPQWEELKRRAIRNNRTVQQIAEATVRDMYPLFFDHIQG